MWVWVRVPKNAIDIHDVWRSRGERYADMVPISIINQSATSAQSAIIKTACRLALNIEDHGERIVIVSPLGHKTLSAGPARRAPIDKWRFYTAEATWLNPV